MKCPHDQTEMDRQTRHGVTIDHCPNCGGVWLDKGEIETMLEVVRPAIALADPEPPAPPAAPPKPRVMREPGAKAPQARPASRRYRGRHSPAAVVQSILDEIFDFDFD